jgi:hypothetical protein
VISRMRVALFILALALVGVAAIVRPAPARAATEFCPARLVQSQSKTTGPDAVHYSYNLQALSPRTVKATIVAETDQGWFTWQLTPVELTTTTFSNTSAYRTVRYKVAQSPRLSVTFPIAVQIFRAWVASAQTSGEETFGWDAHGVFNCSPPDPAAYHLDSGDTNANAPEPSDPTPAPAPPAAVAVATTAPFPIAKCDKPFVDVRVLHAEQPVFPRSVAEEAFNTTADVQVYVAVDRDGKLADAWLLATSGYRALDLAAITAAKESTYAPAVSYCRPVGATYIFTAEFQPVR